MSEINVENQSAEKKPLPQQTDTFTSDKKNRLFSGRSGRKEFWGLVIFISTSHLMLSVFALLTAAISETITLLHILPVLLLLPMIFWIVIMLASVRRLHDTNRSARYLLLNLLPLAGQIILLILCAQSSCQADNIYGPNTSVNKRDGLFTAIGGFIMIAFSFLLTLAVLFFIFLLVIIHLSTLGFFQDQKECKHIQNLKNVGIAMSVYQNQYNDHLPDKKGIEGLQQLKTLQTDLKLEFTCQNGHSFVYVGSGITPFSAMPTVICISKHHPGHIHYATAEGKVECLKVEKHPETVREAVTMIFDDLDNNAFGHLLTFGFSKLIQDHCEEKMLKNADLIDHPPRRQDPDKEKNSAKNTNNAAADTP